MRRHLPWTIATTFLLSLAGASSRGAESTPAGARPPPPAPPAESHQFDFWIGEWTVTNPAGKHAGDSKIERIANGCGLLENWTGARGYSGKSLNAWNAPKKEWQQFWVGSDGGVLELAGGLDGQGRMVLSGEHATAEGIANERITWTPNADGSVEQVWEQSTDGGKTWRVVFDGHYARKEFPSGGASPHAMRFWLQ